MEVEDGQLIISTIGQSANSILLSSYLLFGGRAIPCTSLVDSGCTALAFLDEDFARQYKLPLQRLLRKRPLFLADGKLAGWIEKAIDLPLGIGDHREVISFFVTSLAPDNPIILGLPWLQRHNPEVNWDTLRLRFTSRCRGRCLPLHIAGQVAPIGLTTRPQLPAEPDRPVQATASTTRKTSQLSLLRFQATVEDVEDEGEPDAEPPQEPLEILPSPEPTLEPLRPFRRPKPSQLTAEQRRPAHRFRLQQLRRPLPQQEQLNLHDIKMLDAAAFAFVCKQQGATVMRVTMEELERAAERGSDCCPAECGSECCLTDLPDDFFKSLLQRNGTADQFKARLPVDFHSFVDDLWADGMINRRITEDDAQKFFKKADLPEVTADDAKRRLPAEYRDLFQAFLSTDANTLPPHRSYDHKIEVVPGGKLPCARNRPLSPMELRVLKRWLDDNLAKGFIRPSKSGVASPVLLAQKPGGGVRICVDYRGLNNVTLKSRYPIPLIRETLDAICKAEIFTKLDVIAAFNRVRVAEGHEWLTAFVTRFGLYESLVTPFGLQGAPATFQYYVNDILYDLLDDCVTAYLDDILICSTNKRDHVRQVREVLKRLADAGLQVDLDKCEFHTTKTKYLGLVIKPGRIEMDPTKVEAVVGWEAPTTKKQLQRFLGFANFYRRFIKDFSGVARPLYDLTKLTADWTWHPIHQQAFEALKDSFVTAPALRIYDWERPAVVEVDASNWSAGGTLLQPGDGGELHPVAYFSSKHSAQECNYDIYDKELLAVVKALEEWRPELEGAAQRFDIVTDHKNLQTFATTKQLSPRHMRWSEFLSRFNFRVVYRPGAANARPDALSRKPEHMPADEADDRLRNRRRALIDPLRFDPISFRQLQLFQLDVSQPIDNLITASYQRSSLLADVVTALTDPAHRA